MNALKILRDLVDQAIQLLPATEQRRFACRKAQALLRADRAAGLDSLASQAVIQAAILVARRFAAGHATVEELEAANQASGGQPCTGLAGWTAYVSTSPNACYSATSAAQAAAIYSDDMSLRLQERVQQLEELLTWLAQ